MLTSAFVISGKSCEPRSCCREVSSVPGSAYELTPQLTTRHPVGALSTFVRVLARCHGHQGRSRSAPAPPHCASPSSLLYRMHPSIWMPTGSMCKPTAVVESAIDYTDKRSHCQRATIPIDLLARATGTRQASCWRSHEQHERHSVPGRTPRDSRWIVAERHKDGKEVLRRARQAARSFRWN